MNNARPGWRWTTPALRREAFAKINLTLAVHGRRPDGFHELTSWVAPIGLADELTFSPADRFELRIETDSGATIDGGTTELATGSRHWRGGNAPLCDPELANDHSNLVTRAALTIANSAGVAPAVCVRLVKRIPMGAGLGGGSSDAATTIMALNDVWGLDWPPARLAAIGATLGSDVPLFLYRRQLVMRGRGEIVEPLARTIRGWVVLIVPPFGVSTAAVYSVYAARESRQDRDDPPWTLTSLRCTDVMPRLFNDLEPAAFAVEPQLATLHARLDGFSGAPVRMTGSGSALFTLFEEAAAARTWADEAAQIVASGTAVGSFPLLLPDKM